MPVPSRRSMLLAAAAVLLALAGVASGRGIDETRVIAVSREEAIDSVRAFVAGTALTDDVVAEGPYDGALVRFYKVTGHHLMARVDANTGSVVGVVFLENIGQGGKVSVDSERASVAAKAFLDDHSIGWRHLEPSIEFIDHGETAEYLLQWTRRDGDLVLPEAIYVSVDAVTGKVISFADMRRPFEAPGEPSVDRPAAIAASVEVLRGAGVDGEVAIDAAELRVEFAESGDQRLVWKIRASAVVERLQQGQEIVGHWLVEVDARSGQAKIVARG
jgi:hypothetical protein